MDEQTVGKKRRKRPDMDEQTVGKKRRELQLREAEWKRAKAEYQRAKAEWERAEKKRQRAEQRQKERAEKKRQRAEQRQKERAEKKQQREVLRAERAIKKREGLKNYPKFARKLERKLSKEKKVDEKMKQPKPLPMTLEVLMRKLKELGPKNPVLQVATGLAEAEVRPDETGGDAEPLRVLIKGLEWKTYFKALLGWLQVLDLKPASHVVDKLKVMSKAETKQWLNGFPCAPLSLNDKQKLAIQTVCNAIIGGLQRVWKATSEKTILNAKRFRDEVVCVKGLVLWPDGPNNFPKAPVLTMEEQLERLEAANPAKQ